MDAATAAELPPSVDVGGAGPETDYAAGGGHAGAEAATTASGQGPLWRPAAAVGGVLRAVLARSFTRVTLDLRRPPTDGGREAVSTLDPRRPRLLAKFKCLRAWRWDAAGAHRAKAAVGTDLRPAGSGSSTGSTRAAGA